MMPLIAVSAATDRTAPRAAG